MTPTTLTPLINRLCTGELLTPDEALSLVQYPLPALTAGAKKIKEHFCSDSFQICTTLTTEDLPSYSIPETTEPMDPVVFLEKAATAGIGHCAISPDWTENSSTGEKASAMTRQCALASHLSKHTPVRLCLHSHHPMAYGDYSLYKAAGITRARLDLTCVPTADAQDRKGLYAALASGFSGCSALTLDSGDSLEDRIAFLFELRILGIRSIPVVLSPDFCNDKKNDLTRKKEILQAIALCRFVIPDAGILITPDLDRLFGDRRALLTAGSNGICTSFSPFVRKTFQP